MKRRCQSCGGTYAPTLADNTAYFHVCPAVYDPVTGTWAPRPGGRNENVPPAAVLAVQLDAVCAPTDPYYNQKRTAAAAAAMVSAGAGVAVVPAPQGGS